ncbi:hypothetical protein [Luminiphilus syltensis]|nr:hypothetical protein [Luminiphilus syltensis]
MRGTVRFLLAVFFLGLPGVTLAQELPDAERWFINDYAPLWSGDMPANLEKLKQIYADEIVSHHADGAVTRDSQQSWLVEPMQGWLAEGWLGSTLISVNVQPINATTVAFSAEWRDDYEGGGTERACGWYLADAMNGGWMITEYADRPCSL